MALGILPPDLIDYQFGKDPELKEDTSRFLDYLDQFTAMDTSQTTQDFIDDATELFSTKSDLYLNLTARLEDIRKYKDSFCERKEDTPESSPDANPVSLSRETRWRDKKTDLSSENYQRPSSPGFWHRPLTERPAAPVDSTPSVPDQTLIVRRNHSRN